MTRLALYSRRAGKACLGLALCYFMARPAQSQSTARLATAVTSKCSTASAVVTTSLEKNNDVVAAAKAVAQQMIGQYDPAAAAQPDLGVVWGNFNLAVVTAAHPSCTAKSVAPVANDKQVTASTAQATTAQTNKQVSSPPSSDGSTSTVQRSGYRNCLG